MEGFNGPEIVGGGTPTVQEPVWSFSMGMRSPAGVRNLATVDRISLGYFDHANTNTVSVDVSGPSGSQTRLVTLTSGGGSSEKLQYRDAWFRYTDTSVQTTVSGIGEFHIQSLDVDLFTDPNEARKP